MELSEMPSRVASKVETYGLQRGMATSTLRPMQLILIVFHSYLCKVRLRTLLVYVTQVGRSSISRGPPWIE